MFNREWIIGGAISFALGLALLFLVGLIFMPPWTALAHLTTLVVVTALLQGVVAFFVFLR